MTHKSSDCKGCNHETEYNTTWPQHTCPPRFFVEDNEALNTKREEKIIAGLNHLIIAWDVDDTLIVPSVVTGSGIDTPNYENITIYNWFKAQGARMIIWSGGGVDYAARWAEKLGLEPDLIIPKTKESAKEHGVDICFDDCIVELADKNFHVKRLENGISRKEWNEHKATD